MTGAAGLLRQAGEGIALGLAFNPVTSLAAAVVAAALAGYPKAPPLRRWLAVAVLAGAWLVGDGTRIGAFISRRPPAGWQAWLGIALWAAVGVALGYVVPIASGIMAGRGVIRGTGWLSAGAVAFMVGGAIAMLAPSLAEGIMRVAGGAL